MFSPQFVFRFIRDLENERTDDFLRIYRTNIGKPFVLTYETFEIKSKHTKQFSNINNLLDYLGAYLSLLKYDDDPFERVQVEPYHSPAILFKHDDFQHAKHKVLDLILSVFAE